MTNLTEDTNEIGKAALIVGAGMAAIGIGAGLAIWWGANKLRRAKSKSYEKESNHRTTPSQANEEHVIISTYDVVAFQITLDSPVTDLWNIYDRHKEEFNREYNQILDEYFGDQIEYTFTVLKGSQKLAIIARFKNAWNNAGARLKKTVDKKTLNVTKLCTRIRERFILLAKRLESLNAPVHLRKAVRVFRSVVNLAAPIVTILNFFGLSPVSGDDLTTLEKTIWAGGEFLS
mgnify:CR=1 FL=1